MANPANSITNSEGIGMQALEMRHQREDAGRPPSRTRCEVSLTSDSDDRGEDEHRPANDTGDLGPIAAER